MPRQESTLFDAALMQEYCRHREAKLAGEELTVDLSEVGRDPLTTFCWSLKARSGMAFRKEPWLCDLLTLSNCHSAKSPELIRKA